MTIIRAEIVVNYYFDMIFNAKVLEECTFLRSYNYLQIILKVFFNFSSRENDFSILWFLCFHKKYTKFKGIMRK